MNVVVVTAYNKAGTEYLRTNLLDTADYVNLRVDVDGGHFALNIVRGNDEWAEDFSKRWRAIKTLAEYAYDRGVSGGLKVAR